MLLKAAALVFAASLCSAAFAEETVRGQVRVSYADLDLSQPANADRLLARLDEAARFACGGSPRFNPRYREARAWAVAQFESCRATAVAQAVAGVRQTQMALSATTPGASR